MLSSKFAYFWAEKCARAAQFTAAAVAVAELKAMARDLKRWGAEAEIECIGRNREADRLKMKHMRAIAVLEALRRRR